MQTNPTSNKPTPLPAVLGFTFTNSLGTAIVDVSIFFLAKHAYGFSTTENFALALSWGLVYIPAAALVTPLLAGLARRKRPVSARRCLVLVMLLMAAACAVPYAWLHADGHSPWPIWVLVPVYAALSGILWPITEAFLAGRRTDKQLRRAIGKFNIAWSLAVTIGTMAIAPFVHQHAQAAVLALGSIHIVNLFLLRLFRQTPGAHVHEPVRTEHPPVYTDLLKAFRILLPTSFAVLAALQPYLPRATEQLELAPGYDLAFAAIWLVIRVATFAVMERFHSWHGSWKTPILGMGLLTGSFAAVAFVPLLLDPAIAVPITALALGCFGAGCGIIYAGALYYAMELHDQLDAGGTHEALIGLGYALGPLLALSAIALHSLRILPVQRFEPIMTSLVVLLTLGVSAHVTRNAFRGRRTRRPI